ncbi:ATP-binding protein [Streptomyces sp. NPDC090085]|uniref:ATP-binding protein n=1 Tax=Streptomyces sp. NPDC090085 TaxID=3365943 RepID=UPI00381E5505
MTIERPPAVPAPVGPPTYGQTYPREPKSAPAARRLVGHALTLWDCEAVADAVAVVTGELVANAIEHGDALVFRLSVARPSQDVVRVWVTDRSHGQPAPRQAADDDEGGRGLAIVAALADDWGIEPTRWGKRVWAEIATTRRGEL